MCYSYSYKVTGTSNMKDGGGIRLNVCNVTFGPPCSFRKVMNGPVENANYIEQPIGDSS